MEMFEASRHPALHNLGQFTVNQSNTEGVTWAQEPAYLYLKVGWFSCVTWLAQLVGKKSPFIAVYSGMFVSKHVSSTPKMDKLASTHFTRLKHQDKPWLTTCLHWWQLQP